MFGPTSVIVPVGTTASVPAQLVLEDGTPLPGRKVNVTYNLGVEYNEHGIPTGTPDAVLVSNTPDTTDGSGNFTPMVEDLSTDPNEPELGGDLVFSSAVSPFGDWNGGAASDNPTGRLRFDDRSGGREAEHRVRRRCGACQHHRCR